ncbi:hypothetical protein [Fluviicola sp.]|uniref:hypothetical protein n=1 Tax=Fluviicola sp. TaxID=1917219 RepID=UPI0026147704|nr:hypothetical protein [Fluviicola sp.]
MAKNKLARHKALGKNSSLSIVEVAQLMDLVTFGPGMPQVQSSMLFFGYSSN